MGTTADKGAYLNTTKSLLKQAINNIGGEVTDETTFREYVNQLENAYDRLPKTEFEEGESVTLENCLKGKLDFDDGKVGDGQSSQESTQGYNLLPPPYETTELNGIKLTNNGDGTYTLNGTSTGQALFWGTNFRSKNIYGEKFVGCPSDWNTAWGYCQIQYDDNTFSGEEKGSGVTLDNSKKIYRTALMIRSGITFTNTIIKPMVTNDTSKTYADFEKYSGGYSSPSPNWEQEVKCVAGRNKWGGFEYTRTFQNITLTFKYNNDGTFIVNGSNTSGSNQNSMPANIVLANNYYKKLSRGTHTIQGGTSNITLQAISITDNSEVSILASSFNGESASFTLNETTKVYLRVQVATGTSFNNEKVYAMLEQGTTATPYLPYNTIEEVVSGKNHANFSFYANNSGQFINEAEALTTRERTNSVSLDEFGIKINQSYTISGLPSGWTLNNLRLYTEYNGSDVAVSGTNFVRNGNTFKITDNNIKYMYLLFGNNDSTAIATQDFYNADIMLAKGNTEQPYEPYITPITKQVHLGTKEMYDGSKIIREGNDWYFYDEYYKVIMDGTETIGVQYSGTANWYYNIPFSSNPKFPQGSGQTTAYKEIKSNYYKINSIGSGNTDLGIAMYSTTIRIREVTEDTASNYKSRLATLYANGNPVYIVYKLATPTKTKITDETLISQLNAWYNAHSNNGTTIITSNGDLPMIIKVRGLKAS